MPRMACRHNYSPYIIDGGPCPKCRDLPPYKKEKDMDCPSNMTKKQLVELINSYPGPEVTLRPRKDTLIETLEKRKKTALTNSLADAEALDMDELFDDVDDTPDMDGPTTFESVMKILKYIIIFGLIAVFFSYLTI